jgi:Zn-dependent protease with chaperone function
LPIDRSGKGERRSRRRVVFWSIGATISLVCVAVFGVPLLADQATPLIPVKVEQKLGATVDVQIRSMLDNGPRGSVFECGLADADNEARAAFGRLIARLEPAAGLPIPLKVAVVRRKEANAITLPGGYVYVFEGLIKESKNVDELAGVIAHEIGHVANRDSTRSVLNAAGLSFLFGMLLGDFVGGGAVILGARALLQSSYSRDVESKADLYAVDLMTKVGGDPGALGAILERIGGATEYGMRVLLDHPETKQRVALIKAAMKQPAGSPLLDDAGWAALKRICGGA